MRQSRTVTTLALAVLLAACSSGPSGPVAPQATAIEPTTAARGESIAVTGTRFGTDPGTVHIGGVEADVTDWTDTSIEATIPADAADAWQEVTVTTAGGTSSVAGLFVGVEFTGIATELQDFLDSTEPGTAVLLGAEDYDLSAATDLFLLDNRSLFGRGIDETSLTLPTAATSFMLSDFGADTKVADLTMSVSLLTLLAGTWEGTSIPLAVAGHASSPMAWQDAWGEVDLAPNIETAAADAARTTFSGVKIVAAPGGGSLGTVPLAITTLEIVLDGVTLDAPDSTLYLLTGGDVLVKDSELDVSLAQLVSIQGSLTLDGANVNALQSLLGADSGLSILDSEVTITDGNLNVTGAAAANYFSSPLPTGGPVEIAGSSISVHDADRADASVVGSLTIDTQIAPIVIRDNQLIRSDRALLVETLSSFTGEADITLHNNELIRAGVWESEDPVNPVTADVVVRTPTVFAPFPSAITLDDNEIAATGSVLVMSVGTLGVATVRSNTVSSGDDSAQTILVDVPGAMVVADNEFVTTGTAIFQATALGGETASFTGNTLTKDSTSAGMMWFQAVGGGCVATDNHIDYADPNEAAGHVVQMLCGQGAPTDTQSTITGNDIAVVGGVGSTIIGTLGGNGTISGNVTSAPGAMSYGASSGTVTISEEIGTISGNVSIFGDVGSDVTLSGSTFASSAPDAGLYVTGPAKTTVTDNSFTVSSTPPAGSTAIFLWATSHLHAFTATGNTFSGFERALHLQDLGGGAYGLDVHINENVFDFTIDAAPKVAELENVKDTIDATNNQWGANTDLATVQGYVTLSGDTGVQGGSIDLDPIKQP